MARISWASLRWNGGTPASGALHSTDVSKALIPGTSIERYGRRWYLGALDWGQRRLVSGRIGFERSRGVTEVWDPAGKDFRPEVIITGATAPFALNLETLELAFQRRPGIIERQSFAGAFQSLLNEASSKPGWTVHLDSTERDFPAFRSSVDRISRLSIRVERPNPRYRSDRVEELLDGAGAHAARLELRAKEGDTDGISPDGDFVLELIDHALRYGNVKAEGVAVEDGEEVRHRFDSTMDGELAETLVPADPDTGEALPGPLRSTVAEEENGTT